MRQNKGITLISVIVYIIVMLMIISIVSVITTSMTTNLGTVEKTSKDVSKINKFDMHFLSDIKKANISIYDWKNGDGNKYIILENKGGKNIQYIFENNTIYRIEDSNASIQICTGITDFYINQEKDKTINVKIQSGDYISDKTYKIGNW